MKPLSTLRPMVFEYSEYFQRSKIIGRHNLINQFLLNFLNNFDQSKKKNKEISKKLRNYLLSKIKLSPSSLILIGRHDPYYIHVNSVSTFEDLLLEKCFSIIVAPLAIANKVAPIPTV